MRSIEDHLEKGLKRVLGKNIPVKKGPLTVSKYTGIRAEVCIHAGTLTDLNGTMPDGAKTSRRTAEGSPGFKGFEEERPGRIEVSITCTTGSYSMLQDLCALVTASTLPLLQTLGEIPLGHTPDKSTTLEFADYHYQLRQAVLDSKTQDDLTYYKGVLSFYLTGFIHSRVMKKGGFKGRSSTSKKLKTKKIDSKSMRRSLRTSRKK